MKLIIDIPEEDYKTIIQRPKQCVVHWDIVDALRNGTPLDDVKAEVDGNNEEKYSNSNENELTKEYIKEQIEEYSRFLDTGIIDEACDDKER